MFTLESAAREVIRRRVREELFEELRTNDRVVHELARVEDAVVRALEDKKIGWALAYLAGVRMAPMLVRQLVEANEVAAQSSPAQPPAGEGG